MGAGGPDVRLRSRVLKLTFLIVVTHWIWHVDKERAQFGWPNAASA